MRENVSYSKKKDFAIVVRLTDYSNKYKGPFLYTSELGYKFLKKSSLVKGDILISNVGANAGLVYRAPNMDVPMTLGPNSILVRSDGNDTEFLYQMMKTTYGEKKIKEQIGISAQPKFNKTEFRQIDFFLPSNDEQKQIGTMFSQLDKTIALHQRMSDKQKKLKANLLQMMFPRNGEKIPEVRLAGFAEDWAQRTLEDISDKVTEKNKAREFTETLTNSAEYGIISQSDFFDKDISNINSIDGYYVVRPDDFVYNPRISNFAPVGPIKRNNLNRIGIMSPLYYVFRPKGVDHTFLEKYFETSYWHIFMKMNGDSVARADRFAIKDAILKEMPIPYPVKEEQVRIGIFFNQLDKSIALHQEKIAHLKTLKNTLLNKMFI